MTKKKNVPEIIISDLKDHLKSVKESHNTQFKKECNKRKVWTTDAVQEMFFNGQTPFCKDGYYYFRTISSKRSESDKWELFTGDWIFKVYIPHLDKDSVPIFYILWGLNINDPKNPSLENYVKQDKFDYSNYYDSQCISYTNIVPHVCSNDLKAEKAYLSKKTIFEYYNFGRNCIRIKFYGEDFFVSPIQEGDPVIKEYNLGEPVKFDTYRRATLVHRSGCENVTLLLKDVIEAKKKNYSFKTTDLFCKAKEILLDCEDEQILNNSIKNLEYLSNHNPVIMIGHETNSTDELNYQRRYRFKEGSLSTSNPRSCTFTWVRIANSVRGISALTHEADCISTDTMAFKAADLHPLNLLSGVKDDKCYTLPGAHIDLNFYDEIPDYLFERWSSLAPNQSWNDEENDKEKLKVLRQYYLDLHGF